MKSTDFENHSIFEKLEQFQTRINDSEVKNLIGTDDLHFFESAVQYLKDRLNITIPILINDAEFNNLDSELTSGLQQLNNYLGNKNIGHLNNSKSNLLSSITRARNLPLPFSKNNFNFSKSIANFETILKNKLSNISSEKESLENEINELKNRVSKNDQESERIKKVLEQKEIEIGNINSRFETDFENIKSSATQAFEQEKKSFRSEFDQVKESLHEEVDKLKQSINSDTETLIDDLTNKLEEAKKIMGVISDVTVTGDYQNVATGHKRTADIFRLVAIALMLILSFLLISTIWKINSGNYDWTISIVRILAAAALSYPATYAARESSKHRNLEVINRKAALELAAIGPFIELMPEDKKEAIKEKLVGKYFGNTTSETKPGDEEITISGLGKIIDYIVPLVKK